MKTKEQLEQEIIALMRKANTTLIKSNTLEYGEFDTFYLDDATEDDDLKPIDEIYLTPTGLRVVSGKLTVDFKNLEPNVCEDIKTLVEVVIDNM